MCSLATEKTNKKWKNMFSWLEFNNANLICKLCYWCADQNGMAMSSNSKFLQDSSKYHNLSAPHALTRMSKENFDDQKPGSSNQQEKSFNKFHLRV